MKKLFFLLAGIIISCAIFAQSPLGINYQAVLRNSDGSLKADQNVEVSISIIQGSVNGTEVYSETHNASTNTFGVINLIIGSVNQDSFSNIDWSNTPYFLSIKVDGIDAGTNQLLSVPYAFYANSAGNTFSGDFNDLTNIPQNLDTDNSDDFNGDFNSLNNIPLHLDTDSTNDFDGDFNKLKNIPEHLDTDSTNDFDGDFNNLKNIPDHLDTDSTNDFDGDYNNLTNKPVFSFYWGDKDKDGYGDQYKAIYAPEAPEGYLSNADDCNDDNANVYPGAEEICDRLDNDCDGEIDEDAIDVQNWYLDNDHDGFGNELVTVLSCYPPLNYVENPFDCNDDDENINPDAIDICDNIDNNCNGEIDENTAEMPIWFIDSDEDGFGSSETTMQACNQPVGYVENSDDCDDTNPEVNPESMEVCDNIDNNCNGEIDDETIDGVTWYIDMDTDGYGSHEFSIISCTQPDMFVSNADDCDDENADVHPGAIEILDNMDNDCDGMIDEGTELSCLSSDDCPPGSVCMNGICTPEYETEDCSDGIDNDGDGYTDCDDNDCLYNPACLTSDADNDGIINGMDNCPFVFNPDQQDTDGDGIGDACQDELEDLDGDGYASDVDCDDLDAFVFPGAVELADGIDNDCDGIIDEGTEPSCSTDADCPMGTICSGGECIPELQPEICNDGIDNDGDGLIDCEDNDCDSDGFCLPDSDDDGDGVPNLVDNCPLIPNPDQLDSNGDGIGDACQDELEDLDGDGYTSDVDCNDLDPSINPGADEFCDGIDNNCNVSVDEGAIDASTWYIDMDGDGYGNEMFTMESCDQPMFFAPFGGDCDDNNPLVYPGSTEVCGNSIDDDCDSIIDEGC